MGLMLWRLSQWLSGSLWVVWALAAWLVQHFIVHYQKMDVAPGWNAPRKIERWYKSALNRETTRSKRKRRPPDGKTAGLPGARGAVTTRYFASGSMSVIMPS
jgi:hypothetical protein